MNEENKQNLESEVTKEASTIEETKQEYGSDNLVQEESKQIIELPKGCTISTEKFDPSSVDIKKLKQEEKAYKKLVKESGTQLSTEVGKVPSNAKRNIVILLAAIIAVGAVGIFALRDKIFNTNNTTEAENIIIENPTTVATITSAKKETEDDDTELDVKEITTKEDSTETTEEREKESKSKEKTTEKTTEATTEKATEKSKEATTEKSTERSTERTTEATTDKTTERQSVIDNQTVSIGGIDVIYGFDNSWETNINESGFQATKSDNGKYVSLYITDSFIGIGKINNVKVTLKGVENPFKEDTSYSLSDSKDADERNIHGRTCYVTYYTGSDTKGNPITTIGIMQDIGGSTYAYITIKDTFGYDIDTLLDSLSVNVE